MNAAPRITPFAEDQIRQWAELLSEALIKNEELRGRWLLLRYVMAYMATAVLGLAEHPIQPPVRDALAAELDRRGLRLAIPEWEEHNFFLGELVDAMRKRFPKLEHAFGEHLPAWVRHVTYLDLSFTADDEALKVAFREAALAVELKFERLLPDNPIRLDESLKNATPEQAFQIRNLIRAFRDARPPGRPKKPAGQGPARAGIRTLDPALSDKAYRMKSDGADWTEIARACYLSRPPAERRTAAMRKHIARLIHRGEINARYPKKSGRRN